MSFEEHVNHDLIAEAVKHHAEALERLTVAASQLAQAAAVLEDASQVNVDAVRGKAAISPLEADEQHEHAARRHRVAERVHEAAKLAVKDAYDGQIAARGKAWRPVYLQAVRRRLAAAKAADDARAAIATAEAAHADATKMMNEAHAQGTVGVEYMRHRLGMMPYDEEMKLWLDNGFDPAAGTYHHWV